MLHIPILRHGRPYTSVETVEVVHHATGEPAAAVSQANSGLISRDVRRMDDAALERFAAAQLIDMSRRAADLFMGADLPLGDARQSFDDYLGQLSATTGMPRVLCRANAEKLYRVMSEVDRIVGGLTRGLDLSILDGSREDGGPSSAGAAGVAAVTQRGGGVLSFYREGRIFGAVLPSNSPGVHGLWIPAIVLKAPIVLKPGREEPWTPYRIIQAFIAAGAPPEAFGFYPTDHAGAAALLRAVDRSMLFGDASTTRPWADDPRVELHGPGYSKIVIGEDAIDRWPDYVELMVSSILANGGRSCINASGVWVPRHGRAIADALAKELAKVRALPADHPEAKLAAFANPAVAEAINAAIDRGLREPGAMDLTEKHRGSPRLERKGRVAYLLPTVIWIDPARCSAAEPGGEIHPLANREFLFPFASVVQCAQDRLPRAVGRSLIVTAITRDPKFKAALLAAGNVDRLNLGPIPTWQLSWDQPHEGNLFEHLYRQRALQIGAA